MSPPAKPQWPHVHGVPAQKNLRRRDAAHVEGGGKTRLIHVSYRTASQSPRHACAIHDACDMCAAQHEMRCLAHPLFAHLERRLRDLLLRTTTHSHELPKEMRKVPYERPVVKLARDARVRRAVVGAVGRRPQLVGDGPLQRALGGLAHRAVQILHG